MRALSRFTALVSVAALAAGLGAVTARAIESTPAAPALPQSPAADSPASQSPAPQSPAPAASVAAAPAVVAPPSATSPKLDLKPTGSLDPKAGHPDVSTGLPAIMPADAPATQPAADAAHEPAPEAAAPSKPGQDDKAGQGDKAGREDKGVDPEPDVAIQPPPAAPSTDPLDKVPQKPVDAATAPAEAPLPPLNAAIKAAVERLSAAEIKGTHAAERRKEREAIAFFYAAHDFAPLWSAEGTPIAAVEPVIARLAHAGDDALSIGMTPASLVTTGSPDAMADSELALSEAVVAYARQASGSRIEPRSIAPLIGLKPDLADATEALETVAAAGADAGERLHAYNPSEPRYVALREKLIELRAAHAPAVASLIPAGPALRVGMSDPRVPLIRSRFSLDGTPNGKPQDMLYDTEVAAAVADFQRANGLPGSGVLTRRTIAALSGGHPSRLEHEIEANMELWRWMPRDLGADHIEVNVPEFAVNVFHDGTIVSTNKVVVGKKDTPTPLFSNKMQTVIVNPVWNVPESIIKKEMLPKLAQDPLYLDRLGYKVVEKHGRLTVQQPSGEKNALGRVKFIFPNDYAVYLHDTPSKALFASTRRAFSHGCVRVDQPFRFAETVLGSERWSERRLKGLLGTKERYVSLPKPLPIHIEYFTAVVEPNGHLALHDDVYGYVRRIEAALGEEG